MNAAVMVATDRRTAVFYATLLALVALDLILLFWLFNPFTRFGTVEQSRPVAQEQTKVDQTKKPSPFESTRKTAALSHVSVNRTPKPSPANSSLVALRRLINVQ